MQGLTRTHEQLISDSNDSRQKDSDWRQFTPILSNWWTYCITECSPKYPSLSELLIKSVFHEKAISPFIPGYLPQSNPRFPFSFYFSIEKGGFTVMIKYMEDSQRSNHFQSRNKAAGINPLYISQAWNVQYMHSMNWCKSGVCYWRNCMSFLASNVYNSPKYACIYQFLHFLFATYICSQAIFKLEYFCFSLLFSTLSSFIVWL